MIRTANIATPIRPIQIATLGAPTLNKIALLAD